MTKNQPKKSSGVPLAIIAAVLVVAIGAIWWFYNSSKPAATNSNRAANTTTANTARTPQTPVVSSVGAQPPNMLGSPTATVTLEEFADFQCGSCASAHPTMKEIQQIYGSKIKFIFRSFPLAIPAHDKAYDAAVAAEAAGLQGKYWAMQDQLFINQQAWTQNPGYKQLWADYAEKIGLDQAKFQNDVAGRAAKERVDADIQRGKGLGVSSTPSVYINGIAVPFQQVNVPGLRVIIDAELQKPASATTTAPANTNSK